MLTIVSLNKKPTYNFPGVLGAALILSGRHSLAAGMHLLFFNFTFACCRT